MEIERFLKGTFFSLPGCASFRHFFPKYGHRQFFQIGLPVLDGHVDTAVKEVVVGPGAFSGRGYLHFLHDVAQFTGGIGGRVGGVVAAHRQLLVRNLSDQPHALLGMNS